MNIEEKLDKILSVVESNSTIHPSTPGKFSEVIKDTSEKAFQRAILLEGKTTIDDSKTEITWYDIELPVVLNRNSRRSCIDLIGFDTTRFVLVELKFNNKSDSPISATRELLEYYRLICKNADLLDKYSIHHKNNVCKKNSWQWNSIVKSNPLLIIAANESYWNHWKKNHLDFKVQFNQIESWSTELGIDIALYSIKDCDFKSQRINDQPYTPRLIENYPWNKI